MAPKLEAAITPVTRLSKRHKSWLEERVFKEHELLVTQHDLALRESFAGIEQRLVDSDLTYTGEQPSFEETSPARLSTAAVREARREGGETGKQATALAREITRERIGLLRDVRRSRRAMEYTAGNPTTLTCLWRADTSAMTGPSVITLNGGVVGVSPPVLGTTIGTAGVNQLSFVAAVDSAPANVYSFARFAVSPTFWFSFRTNMYATGIEAHAFLQPLGLVRSTVPDAVYLFPFDHAVPWTRVVLKASVRVFVLANSGGGFVERPGSGAVAVVDDQLSGWGGAKVRTTVLGSSYTSISPPGFLVFGGSLVVIGVTYQMYLVAGAGGNIFADLNATSAWGLNVPGVWVKLDGTNVRLT